MQRSASNHQVFLSKWSRHQQCRVRWRADRWLEFLGSMNKEFSTSALCSVGIGGSVLSSLSQFPSNRSQHVIYEVICRSKLVNVVSGVPQSSVFSCYCSSSVLKKLHKSHLLYILLHLILLHCNVLVICNMLQITLTVIRPA